MSSQISIVTTGVDSLIDLIKQKQKISVEHAAKLLHKKEAVVQSWVDFLLEEKVIGVEYKFVTPYIYLMDSSSKTNFAKVKEDFIAKARDRNISDDEIRRLWKKYVNENLSSIKESFFKKATLRGIHSSKIASLWKIYEQTLLEDIS